MGAGAGTAWNPLIGTPLKHADWAFWLHDTGVFGPAGILQELRV